MKRQQRTFTYNRKTAFRALLLRNAVFHIGANSRAEIAQRVLHYPPTICKPINTYAADSTKATRIAWAKIAIVR